MSKNNYIQKARRWSGKNLKKMAADGDRRAIAELSRIKFFGINTRKDEKKAAELLLKLDDIGDGATNFILGAIYATGRGLKKNTEKAFECFLKAAKSGYSGTPFLLLEMCRRGLIELPETVKNAAIFFDVAEKPEEPEELLALLGVKKDDQRTAEAEIREYWGVR